MDVMVAPERQRQGLGEVLFRTWDRNVGASLGLGLSDSSYRLFQKLRWPDVGPVPLPGQAADAARAAAARPGRSPINRLVSALTLPIVMIVARTRPLARRGPARFSASTTASPRSGSSSRRSSTSPSGATPRISTGSSCPRRTSATRSRRCAARTGTSATPSTATFTSRAAGSRCWSTSSPIPTTTPALRTLLHWVDREARQADSDKIRAFAMHAGFRRVLGGPATSRSSRRWSSSSRSTAWTSTPAFYENTERWHVTLGDSDQDR